MFFHSLSSLFIFLPIFFLIYPLLQKINQTLSKVFLLNFSLIFYAFDIPWFIIPLLISSFSDFFLSKILICQKNNSIIFRVLILIISFIVNLGLLLIFKYQSLISYTFFNSNNNLLFNNLSNNFLPVGISFYTFQTLSFTIDSFKREIKKPPKLIDYLLFVSYFPQLVAGPILRSCDFFSKDSELLLSKNKFNINLGLNRICYGLFLKLCLADELARLNDIAFQSDYNLLGFIDSWTMAFGFGLQIYFDFSAYSHIAIGISRIIGLPIKENFNFPYQSNSVTEFWKRWHISLSSWVSDYLYRFLNKNLSLAFFGALPLLITWLIMGMWHGASWRFAIWGLMNGLLIIIHRAYKQKFIYQQNKLTNFLHWFLTLFSIMSTWIYFRSSSWEQANTLFLKLFKFEGFELSFRENYYLFVFLFAIFTYIFGLISSQKIFNQIKNSKLLKNLLASFALAFAIIFINRQTSFIYFQF